MAVDFKSLTMRAAQLGREKRWEAVLEMIRDLRTQGVLPDEIFLSASITACARASRWQKALALQALAPHSGAAGNAAMAACQRSRQWQAVLGIFESMEQQGAERNIISFTTAVKSAPWTAAMAIAKSAKHLTKDVFFYSGLVGACASDGQWQAALTVLQDMQENAVQPDPVLLGALMRCCETGGWRAALAILDSSGKCCDVQSFNGALAAVASGAQWQRCAALLYSMGLQEAFERLAPDAASCSICITCLARCGHWERALEVLRAMPELQVQRNEVSFNAGISACQTPAAALEILQEMDATSVQRSKVSFNAALAACGSSWEEALSLLEQMKCGSLEPDAVTFSSLLSACEAHPPKALEVLRRFLAEGGVPHGLQVGSVLKGLDQKEALALLSELRRLWASGNSGDGCGENGGSVEGPDFSAWQEVRPRGSGDRLQKPVDVIYADETLVAIGKTPEVSTEQALQSLANQLKATLFSVSRLDLPTSGVLPAVIGGEKTVQARWYLAQFAGAMVDKEYLCLCHGLLEPSGSICLPLRTEATSASSSRAVVDEALGQSAHTSWRTLARLRSSTGEELSLLEAKPKTGRLHQIRAHLAAKNHPIVGDALYGSGGWCRLFLHCRQLRLFGLQGPVQLKAELPKDLCDILGSLQLISGTLPDIAAL
ncbi:unnamed protein product, partial [Effrenium voratum]